VDSHKRQRDLRLVALNSNAGPRAVAPSGSLTEISEIMPA
jgi:hypothetical protein